MDRNVEAIGEMQRACFEALLPDWDGYGAQPVSSAAVRRAEWFLHGLPEWAPVPEFCCTPDGGVSLDWMFSRQRIVSISIYADSYISAGADGESKWRGRCSILSGVMWRLIGYILGVWGWR